MKKLFLMSLVVVITFSLFWGSMSYKGVSINRAIAMEQRIDQAMMLKPVKPVFPQIAPDDPNFKFQWSLDDYGKAYTSGVGNKKVTIYSNYGIQAQKAWKLGYTGNGVKIAVIGYGVAYKNLDANGDGVVEIYKNKDFANTSFDETNAIDLTKYSGDITADLAANTVDMTKFGKDPVDNSISTHMVGIMAASTNDSYGCAGIAYGATILPIKAWSLSSDTVTGITNRFVSLRYAINYAVDKGANVIYTTNMSSDVDSDLLHEAIQHAVNEHNVVFICSNWPSATQIYPQAYDEVIAVGAANFNGVPTYQSMYGDWLDLLAPGGNINEDLNKDNYNDGILFSNYRSDYHGVAGAHVAGIVALILEKNPNLTPDQVRQILINAAKDDKSEITYPNQNYGYGSVDAYGALVITPNP